MIIRSFLLAFIIVQGIVSLAQVPVEGDELLKILGLRNANDKVAQMEKYLDKNVQKNGYTLSFDNNVLVRIVLYNSNNPYFTNVTPFAGAMPKGLDFSQTIFKCKSILGEGFEEDGDKANRYEMSKKFPHGDMDAVEIKLDFVKGKLAMVSLILARGAAEEAEDKEGGGGSESVIRSDDYFMMIKKNFFNKEVERFTETLDERGVYRDRKHIVYIHDGVEFHINDMKHIDRIIFYSGGQSVEQKAANFEKFTGKLPYNLKFTDTKAIVQEKAGAPTGGDGNMMLFKDSGCEVEVYFSGANVNKVIIGIPKKKTEGN